MKDPAGVLDRAEELLRHAYPSSKPWSFARAGAFLIIRGDRNTREWFMLEHLLDTGCPQQESCRSSISSVASQPGDEEVASRLLAFLESIEDDGTGGQSAEVRSCGCAATDYSAGHLREKHFLDARGAQILSAWLAGREPRRLLGRLGAPVRESSRFELLVHEELVCHAVAPSCDQCPLVSFCATGVDRVRSSDRPAVIDLFGGVGGLGLGFEGAGFRIALSVEFERNAAQTYRLNHPGVPVIERDVATVGLGEVEEFVGLDHEVSSISAGPPCQGYSAAGKRDPTSPLNNLYKQVSRIAALARAKSIVIENVPGVRKVSGVSFEDRIQRSLHRSGYRAGAPRLLCAADFGVPQSRRRLIYLGIRSDLVSSSVKPDYSISTDHFQRSPSRRTVESALSDLPELHAGEGTERAMHAGSMVYNHVAMRHSERVIEKIAAIEPGGGPISYRRLDRNLARTLVAGHRAMPVHPWLDRTITVREAARIQGFPDDYIFAGPRANQPLQVANAVPPRLALAVAMAALRAAR